MGGLFGQTTKVSRVRHAFIHSHCFDKIYPPGVYFVYNLFCMNHDVHKKLARRLKIIEGQIRGVQKMTENHEYCVDIIIQIMAIKQALTSFEETLLENHLSTHVVEQMKSGQHKKAIDEVMKMYRLSNKGKR